MKKYITKQSSIKGAGKGLFTNASFKKGEVIGLAHVDDQPASEIGRNHNHNEKNPTAYSKKIDNKRYIYASKDLKPGEEITTNYRMQPELEQPEDFMRKGGAVLKMPNKKNSKGYSRSLSATNKLFTQNFLFAKPKSRKNKVFDPNSKYYAEGGESEQKIIFSPKKGVCPIGEYWNGTKCVKAVSKQPTYADSLFLYNNSLDLDKWMKQNKYYWSGLEKYKSNKWDKENLYDYLKKGHEREIQAGTRTKPLSKHVKKVGNFIGTSDWLEGGFDDYGLPFTWKHPNIKPQQEGDMLPPTGIPTKVGNINRKALSYSFRYDPIAIKPSKLLTDAEIVKRYKKYGKSGIEESRLKKLGLLKDNSTDSPITRTVYIDCPPGSVSNDEKTEVITNDPDSPGNYLRTITTGCKPEKIENLPLLKPSLIQQKNYELQGNPLNEEELELPNEEVESEYLEEGSPDTENPMEWVNKRKYDIDWNGIQIPYRLPRFRKPGSYGDLIKPGKKRYINLPTIESRNTAYLRPKKQDGGNTDAMTGMMKARLAYANEFGNPAAKRMINLPDTSYQFDNGDTGTHYMASMDNYAVPQIQDETGVLQLGDYGPESNEAIRFDSDEDANYFAENYKDVSPGFIEAELDEDEIEEYRRGGYIVEEIDNYQDGGVYTVKGSDGNYKKVNGKWQVDWNKSGKYQPLSKGDVKARTAVLDKMAKPVDNGISKVSSNSSDNTRVNYQKPLVESFNRSNNLESFYKKEREKDLQKQKDAVAYHDKTQKVKQNQSFGEFINQDVLGIPTLEEQTKQVNNDKRLLKKELKPYFETEKEIDQFISQQYSRPTASAENNWNDGPIQMVYPEKYLIGPGGGMIGNIKNLGKNTFNLGKKILSNPYVSGGLNAYFGAEGINEFSDPNSLTRKSMSRAYNNPTGSNIGDAAFDVSMNLLNFSRIPFGKAIKGSKNLINNTYKINPRAFKPNPEAYYHRSPNLENIVNRETGTLQGFGNSKAGIEFSKDAGPGGTGNLAIRGDGSISRINLKKPANSQLYFAKGVPLDFGRYNKVLNKKTGKLIDGQGYEGPYMVQVKGVPMGASTKGRAPGADVTNIGGYAVPRRPISLDEAKFYKEHWLKGYKEVPKQYINGGSTNDYVDVDLTLEEIKDLIAQGYVIEELN